MKRWIDAARARFELLLPGRAERRMDEELAFHIDMEAQRIEREEGISAAEARRRALATFGGATRHKETLREGRGLAWLDTISLDLRLGGRMLRKTPGLTVVAVVGLSIVVAIGCVCFSAVYRIIDARLPVSEGERVIGIRNIDRRAAQDARGTHLQYLPLWRSAMKDVAELGAYRNLSRNVVTADGWSESARVAEMTASGFRIARVGTVVGRTLVEADEAPGAPPVAVIGYRIWQQRYMGRADIVGQTIQVGDVRHTIVGVMPEGFAFPVNNRIWIPLRLEASQYPPFQAPGVDVFGRLADGKSIDDVRQRAELVNKRLAATDSVMHGNLHQRVIPYTRTFIDNGDAVWTYHLIQALVTLLLVVIGINVAVLMYARTAGRMGEIAVRTALGASRKRIVGQLFAEALVLSSIAVVVGVGLAWIGMREIDAAIPRIVGEQAPYWLTLRLTPGVIAYAVALGVLGAVIIGVTPALKVTGGRVRASLAELSAGGSSLALGRPWTVMIIAQVTIAAAVLPLAIAGIGTWRRADAAQEKLAGQQILTVYQSFDAPVSGRVDTAALEARQRSLRTSFIEQLRANPRVTDVLLASNAPGDEESPRYEADTARAAHSVGAAETRVDQRYIAGLGIGMLSGRTFGPADYQPGANVLIVNQSFVRKMFDGKPALGARVRIARERGRTDAAADAPWQTIVGVIRDFPVDSGASPRTYVPLNATATEPVMIAIKLSGGSALDFVPAVRAAASAAGPTIRLEKFRTLAEAVYDAQSGTRLMVVVIELITLVTILLSAAGIYALMAFTITRRRREIGIRSALGAAPGRLLTTEIGRVLARIAIGITIGTAIAWGIDTVLQGGWTGRGGLPAIVTVAALMFAVGLLSALRPAIGALRIQPTEALRSD